MSDHLVDKRALHSLMQARVFPWSLLHLVVSEVSPRGQVRHADVNLLRRELGRLSDSEAQMLLRQPAVEQIFPRR